MKQINGRLPQPLSPLSKLDGLSCCADQPGLGLHGQQQVNRLPAQAWAWTCTELDWHPLNAGRLEVECSDAA